MKVKFHVFVCFVYFPQRRDVVMGTVEPTDSDCEWESDDEEDEEEKVDALAVCRFKL